MRALIAATLLTLTACAPGPVRLATPPVELQHCQDEPTAPDLEAMPWEAAKAAATALEAVDMLFPVFKQRGQDTLDYVLASRKAGGDCRAKVDGVKAWAAEVE